jgi:hypothetical protein
MPLKAMQGTWSHSLSLLPSDHELTASAPPGPSHKAALLYNGPETMEPAKHGLKPLKP